MKGRINFIFPYNTWGGAFRSTYVLSNYLINNGWSVTITFPIIPPRNGYKFFSRKWISIKFIGIIRSLVRRNKIRMNCKADIKCVPWISSLWIKDADFVIANHWNTIHDVYNLNQNCGKKIIYIRDIEEWAHYFQEELEAFRLPIYKLATTKWIKKHLYENYSIKVNKIISNGTHTDPFILKSPKPSLEEINIGMCCAKHPMKGIEYGLEAIKKIKKENPKVNIILYGYYKPEKFDVEYEWVQSPVGEKLRETYRKIHIFISSSLQEGCHNPPREAMAAECALVATNVGCIPDIAKNNINALIVKPGSTNEIVNAVTELINCPEKIQNLASNAKQRILLDTWDSKVYEFESVLNNL